MPAQRFVSRPDTAWIGRQPSAPPRPNAAAPYSWSGTPQEEPWTFTDRHPIRCPSWFGSCASGDRQGQAWAKGTRRGAPPFLALARPVGLATLLAYGTRSGGRQARRIAQATGAGAAQSTGSQSQRDPPASGSATASTGSGALLLRSGSARSSHSHVPPPVRGYGVPGTGEPERIPSKGFGATCWSGCRPNRTPPARR